MFAALRTEFTDRLFSAELFVKELVPIQPPTSRAATAAKGLAFVQMYAAWEHTVNSAFSEAVAAILARGLEFQQLRHELLGIALEPQFMAVRDCGRERMVETRVELLQKINSSEVITAPCTFPLDGSQYRPEQLETIWRLLNIPEPIVPNPGYAHVIRDIVERRNAVSHGRQTPEEVGRRYSQASVLERISQIRDVCLYITETIESHCGDDSRIRR